MRYYRVAERFGGVHLAVEAEDGVLVSLTAANAEVRDFRDLLRASHISGRSVDDIARHVMSGRAGKTFKLTTLIEWSRTRTGDARIIRPLDPDEMWAGGPGNYPMTPDAVKALPDATRVVYESKRAPVAFKGTASRLAGPFDSIGARTDVDSTIAEGELVVVIYKGRLVAYSTGDEVVAGLIRESMWWMVPSKVFKGSASLGPCVVTPESLPDPTDRKMELIITRGGKQLSKVEGVTRLRRSPEDLVRSLLEHDSPSDLAILYTGGCVADGKNPLKPGDVARISLEGVGAVENPVEAV